MTLSLWLCVLAQPSPTPRFLVETSSEPIPSAVIRQIHPETGLLLADQPQPIAVQELISLRREGAPTPAWPRGPQLILANGDRLVGEILSGDDSSLNFRLAMAKPDQPAFKIPMSSVIAIWWSTPPSDSPIDPSQYPWIDQSKRRDAILLRNGDRLTGTYAGFGQGPLSVRFQESDGEAQSIPVSRLQCLVLDPSLSRVRIPKTAYARLVLRDGSRLSARIPTAEREMIQVSPLFGSSTEILWSDLAVINFLQNAYVSLSDLPLASQSTPFNALKWPVSVDRTVRQRWLQLNTDQGLHTFDKGLGCQPDCQMRVKLPENFARLEGWVGLEPGSSRGQVQVEIYVDGVLQRLAEDGLVTTGRSALRLNVMLAGAKEVVLKAKFGATGDVQSRLNWGDLRLIRSKN